MIFTDSNVGKAVNTGNVLQGDNVVASVELTDCYEVYAIDVLNQLTYTRIFTDIHDVVDFLNELEVTEPIVPPCDLSKKGFAILKTMSDYYKDNEGKEHRQMYFWDLLGQIDEYCDTRMPCQMTDKDFDNLYNWFDTILNRNIPLQKKYEYYEKKYHRGLI